jgi:hypothetical protein
MFFISLPALFAVCFTLAIMVMYIPGMVINVVKEGEVVSFIEYLLLISLMSVFFILEICFFRIGFTEMTVGNERTTWIAVIIYFSIVQAGWLYNWLFNAISFQYTAVPVLVTIYLLMSIILSIVALLRINKFKEA